MLRHCLASLLCLAAFAARAAEPSDYDFTAVTQLLNNNLDKYQGGVVVVLQQGDREIYTYQSGDIRRDTKKGLASASKWLSAAVVLRLAEKGKFGLDDQVGKHLPIFNTNSKGHVTVRQCFGMTSGLYLTDPNYETQWDLTLAQSVDLIAENTPIVFTPGTKLAYDGDGMQAVGRICEVTANSDWRTLAAQELFTPLGMTGADFQLLPVNPLIAGGARATANEYLSFLRLIMNGGVKNDGTVFLRPRTMRNFFTNATRDLPEYSSPWPAGTAQYPNSFRPDYGFGSWIMVEDGSDVLEVASPGAFGTWPWVDRKRNLRGIIFMHSLTGFSQTVSTNLQILAAIRNAIDAGGNVPLPVAKITASAVSGRAPLTVEFSAAGSTDPEDDPLTCVWDFGSSAVTGAAASHTFATPGSYEVILNVTDTKGSSDTATVTIEVAENHAPEFLSGGPYADPDPVTLPAATTLNVLAEDPDNDDLTYFWEKIDGPGTMTCSANNTTTSDVVSASFSAAGDHVIRVTVTDSYGAAITGETNVTVLGEDGGDGGGGVLLGGGSGSGGCNFRPSSEKRIDLLLIVGVALLLPCVIRRWF